MCAASRIGTEKESSLHEALKRSYAGENGRIEAEVGRYVCDALRSDGVMVEVQTGSFGPLRAKAEALAAAGPVRIVHPIAAERFIELRSKEGALIRRRRSPRRGNPWDLFAVLVYAPKLPLIEGITIELAMTEETEHRIDDGRGSWRRKGVSVANRELHAVRETHVLSQVSDYRRFAPFPPHEDFGVRELAAAADINAALARKTLYVLSRIGVVMETEKKGNAKRYRLK
jgi:hypothetical protein